MEKSHEFCHKEHLHMRKGHMVKIGGLFFKTQNITHLRFSLFLHASSTTNDSEKNPIIASCRPDNVPTQIAALIYQYFIVYFSGSENCLTGILPFCNI